MPSSVSIFPVYPFNSSWIFMSLRDFWEEVVMGGVEQQSGDGKGGWTDEKKTRRRRWGDSRGRGII